MTTCQQKPAGLTIEQTQPLHHLMAQQNMTLLDQLYGRIMQLQQNEKQFIAFLREVKSGNIKLDRLQISDGGFEIMPAAPTNPTEMKKTVIPGVNNDNPKAGSDNGADRLPAKKATPAG